MEDLKEGFGFQKARLAKFVSWNNSWEVALGMQFHAVHQQQLRPPEPDQLISYLQIHYLCRAWKQYSSSLLFSLSTLPVSVFWTFYIFSNINTAHR